jgi:FkbM family methyltransferase
VKALRLLARAFFRTLGYYPTRLNGIRFKCDPYHAWFWRWASSGTWEPATFNILTTFLSHDSICYDVGAWIGPTAIFASTLCKQVVCFEPDPVAYQYLLWNISLNGLTNVLPVNAALAGRDGIMRMASFGDRLGDSMTSLLGPDSKEGAVDVLALRWNTWMEIAKTDHPSFIKIDIEGGEFALLPTMKEYLAEHRPVVFLSTHAPFLEADVRKENMRGIIDVMETYGTCLDERLEPVAIDTLVGEEALEGFQQYVFLD